MAGWGVPTCGWRDNARDADMLATAYRSAKNSDDVFLALPVTPRPANNLGKRIVALVMMSIAAAIAMTLVWHVAESEKMHQIRRIQYSKFDTVSREAERILGKRRNANSLGDTLVKWDKSVERAEDVLLPPKPNVARLLAELEEDSHDEQHNNGALTAPLQKQHVHIPQPKLYEAPEDPPSVEELLGLLS